MAKARDHVGKLAPRYDFLLNPCINARLSKCPMCGRPTHARKFGLFIHVDGFGAVILGKTCRYCSPCELVIAHQHELEDQLTHGPPQLAPGKSRESYLVVGTVDRKVWQKGLSGNAPSLGEGLDHLADFKNHFDLHVEPGGWRPAGEK